MNKFVKGNDFLEKGHDSKTFGIHNETPGDEWGNQIEIYGDEALRDRILRLLQEDENGESQMQSLREPTGLVGDPQ